MKMNPCGSAARLQSALEHASAALAVARIVPDGAPLTLAIDYANASAFRLTGTEAPEGLAEFLEHAITVRPLHSRVEIDSKPGHERIESQHEFVRADGETVHAIIEITPTGSVGPDGIPVVIYLKDITPGRTLQREMERLSALPEANPNIVMIIGCPNRIEYVNATGRQWLADHDASPGEPDKQAASAWDGLRALLPTEFADRICASCDREQRASWTITHEDRTYDVRKTPLADHERCMVTIADVTEFVRLTRQHEIFYRAFQSAHTAIMVTSPEGRIEYVNGHFEHLYGYQADQIRGRTPNILNPGRAEYRELGYSDEEYDALFVGMWEAIQDPQIGFWEQDIPNRTADGRLVWVRLLIHAVRDEHGSVSSYIGFPIDITDSRDRELRLRLEAYEAISDLAELRDNETGNHIKRVGRYSMELARALGHSKNFQEELLNFAPLHDIGKVGIPDDILLAPRKLTFDEFRTMKRHTMLGFELFRGRPSLETAASIARSHHERWDGTGYPDRLAGEAIPLCARIVAVCDVYDALRSVRPYKRPWTHDETARFVREGRGSQFDPAVVDAFFECEECIQGIHAALPDSTLT